MRQKKPAIRPRRPSRSRSAWRAGSGSWRRSAYWVSGLIASFTTVAPGGAECLLADLLGKVIEAVVHELAEGATSARTSRNSRLRSARSSPRLPIDARGAVKHRSGGEADDAADQVLEQDALGEILAECLDLRARERVGADRQLGRRRGQGDVALERAVGVGEPPGRDRQRLGRVAAGL